MWATRRKNSNPTLNPSQIIRTPGGQVGTETHSKVINSFFFLTTHRYTWVQMFLSSTHTEGSFILKRIMDLQETQHSNYKLILGMQTSCCRWDSPRRRSRTRWWIRSTMMWWLHICYWTIGTLRYTVLTPQLLLVCQSCLTETVALILYSQLSN